MNNHVMLDIETLGTDPGSVILSVGMMRFSLNENRVASSEALRLGSWIYANLNIQEQLDRGATVSGSTISWWMNQNENAKDKAFHRVPSATTEKTIEEFHKFFKETDRVWSNGASFDVPLMEAWFRTMAGKTLGKYPWGYTKVRCYRTMAATAKYDKDLIPKVILVAHDPIDDCIYQIQKLQAIAICNPNLNFDK